MNTAERELSAVLSEILALATRVTDLAEVIPEAAFDPETDAPLNPAGTLQAGLLSLLDEELRPAARRVSTLLAGTLG